MLRQGIVPQPAKGRRQTLEEGEMMSANGSFEVELVPQTDVDAPAGRMLMNKSYDGGMQGSGVGQMISKRTEGGAAAYYAIEEFTGSVDGRSGAFTLVHQGYMSADTQSLDVSILDGSGSGDLTTISGSMSIIQDASGHKYVLDYTL